MKLKNILLSVLLEDRTNRISKKFFTRFNPAFNRPEEIKSLATSIKKYIREKESKGTYPVKGTTKVNPALWERESLPEKEIREAMKSAAEKFTESVFSKLNIDLPSNVEYLPGGIKELNLIKNDRNFITSIEGKVYIKDREDELLGSTIKVSIEFPPTSLTKVSVEDNGTLIKYTPSKGTSFLKKGTPYFLWVPEGSEGKYMRYSVGVKSKDTEKVLGSKDEIGAERTAARDALRAAEEEEEKKTGIKKKKEKSLEDIQREKELGIVTPKRNVGNLRAPRKYVYGKVPKEQKKNISAYDMFKGTSRISKELQQKASEFYVDWEEELRPYGKAEKGATPNSESTIKTKATSIFKVITSILFDEAIIPIEAEDQEKISLDPKDKDKDVRVVTATLDKYVKVTIPVNKQNYAVNIEDIVIIVNGVEVYSN